MPIDKNMSMGEIIKKEMASGKSQKQAEAIAYSVKRGNEVYLSAQEHFSSLQMRSARGTERYASKKNGDENIEKHTKIDEDKGFQNEDNDEPVTVQKASPKTGKPYPSEEEYKKRNEDEASEEEHEIQESEVERKEEMTPKGNNSIVVNVINAKKERIDCVECGKQFIGDPEEPHVCPGCKE